MEKHLFEKNLLNRCKNNESVAHEPWAIPPLPALCDGNSTPGGGSQQGPPLLPDPSLGL